jgi:TrmH family RNA methyltransferase
VSGEIIRSPHNSLVKRARSLGARKHRESERAVALEGARLLGAALDASVQVEVVLLAEGASDEARAVAARAGALVRAVDDRVFATLTDTVHSQGVLAIVAEPRPGVPAVSEPFVVALDHIGDPGNLGTIVRTAAAAGVDAVVVSPGCVDAWGAKAVRAGMGAHFLVPLLDGGDPAVVRWLREVTERRFLAAATGAVDYSAADWRGGVAIIVGSEAHGATAWGRELATDRVRIPMVREVESLNAAVAAGVLLFAAAGFRGA